MYREKAERMVRVRSETPATLSPDTGGAETPDPPASIVVNNYYCVGVGPEDKLVHWTALAISLVIKKASLANIR